jgi:hypothetical protein
MNSIGRLISIDKASDGMVLSKDVPGGEGSILVAAGTRLTAKLMESLKLKGVREVCVEEVNENRFTEEEIEAAEREVRKDVLLRFRKDPAGTSMEGIFKAILRLEAIRRLVNGQKH